MSEEAPLIGLNVLLGLCLTVALAFLKKHFDIKLSTPCGSRNCNCMFIDKSDKSATIETIETGEEMDVKNILVG